MSPIRYALIGCGKISANHMKAALANGLEIAAVCDIVPANMDRLLGQYDLADNASIKRYTSHKEMLMDVRPELVAIATQSGARAAVALDCVEAGANLIIEKPIALSLQDADAILGAAKRKGVKVCACFQNRFNTSIQAMRKAMEQGRFGRLSHGCAHVRWNRNRDYYAAASWRGTWAQDGGVLMNQSIHSIDLLRWMMGDEIDEVFAYIGNRFHPYLEAEDVGLAVIKFKNGAIGTLEGTTNVFPKNLEETLYVFGERGTVKTGGKSVDTIDVWEFADQIPDDETVKSLDKSGNGHTPLYVDMIAAIRDDRPPYVDGEAGRRALELVLAVYKSAKEGRPVKLPLSDFSTLDMQS